MNYQESLAYIHSLLRFGIKPGLERISLVLSRLGNPQEGCRCVHIAGTNGKGSTSTMLAAVCRAAGLKTGLYTSPYVVDFRERMQINGEYISQSDLCSYTQRVRIAAETVGVELTEFEFITALAFLWFAESDCDVVVLETGLGGRFDATNVIAKPLASVIVPIGLDHTAILGDTLEAIAFEKAGIIKKGCPVVVACNQPKAVQQVLEKRASEMGSTISFCDAPKVLESGIFGSRFLCGEKEYSVGMMGDYQALNATTVVQTVKAIDLPIKEEHIAEGLQSAFIPARMEKISLSPLTILDGGHNGHAAAAIKSSIANFPQKPIAIIGMMEDKDISDYAALLGECFSRIITVRVADNPRSISAEGLARIFGSYNSNVETASDYAQAIKMAEVGKQSVMVCGSLYLAGGIRPLLLDVFC